MKTSKVAFLRGQGLWNDTLMASGEALCQVNTQTECETDPTVLYLKHLLLNYIYS